MCDCENVFSELFERLHVGKLLRESPSMLGGGRKLFLSSGKLPLNYNFKKKKKNPGEDDRRVPSKRASGWVRRLRMLSIHQLLYIHSLYSL